jgi:hypothetical protein
MPESHKQSHCSSYAAPTGSPPCSHKGLPIQRHIATNSSHTSSPFEAIQVALFTFTCNLLLQYFKEYFVINKFFFFFFSVVTNQFLLQWLIGLHCSNLGASRAGCKTLNSLDSNTSILEHQGIHFTKHT